MHDWEVKKRIAQLKEMHNRMLDEDDEDIYMEWITYGVPDEPTEDNFESIAEDDAAFKECFELFLKLISEPDYL